MANEWKRGFICGFIEGEGYVDAQRVEISNCNLGLLEVCRRYLNDLGIESKIRAKVETEEVKRGKHSKQYVLQITHLRNLEPTKGCWRNRTLPNYKRFGYETPSQIKRRR